MTQRGRIGTMKLDKRVTDLERQKPNTRIRKSHLIGQGAGQTREEAIDAYGRERIEQKDIIIFIVGFSAIRDDEDESTPETAFDR